MAITTAISDLFASIYELFASILGTMYSLVHAVIMAFVNFVTGIFTLAGDILGGVAEMAGGVGKFLASNIAILAIGVIGAVLFVRYTAQGQRVAQGAKKTN
ncbi:hypothetical protein NLU13_9747 [Sarocladium strictum]|uniref:Uncharacterized protein n=1 Tax=Sarocladium strictum TaxID=5046 RepID=A0AA39L456_SARSR|nr:hypothetical protein NLU13_9747 [Sarocladium strictum]